MQKQNNNDKFIIKLKKELSDLNINVGEIEYTENNYDNDGKIINEKIPTITTEYCEIGMYDDNCYFVFVIYAKSFNVDFFEVIKRYKNIQVYDFIDFNKTLYPDKDFDYNNFEKNIQQKKYLQIQFDFNNPSIDESIIDYRKIVKNFSENNIQIVDQLSVDLVKEKQSSAT